MNPYRLFSFNSSRLDGGGGVVWEIEDCLIAISTLYTQILNSIIKW